MSCDRDMCFQSRISNPVNSLKYGIKRMAWPKRVVLPSGAEGALLSPQWP